MDKPMSKEEKQAAYDAWYIAEVDKGIADVEAGLTIPHDEVIRQARLHIEKIAKKNAKAA